MKRTGPTNVDLQGIIHELKKLSGEKKAPVWKAVAQELERPTRQRRVVNLSHLDTVTKDKDIIIVPGKVLGTGSLSKKITLAAWSWSESVSEKVKDIISIQELMKKHPDGKKVRIIG